MWVPLTIDQVTKVPTPAEAVRGTKVKPLCDTISDPASAVPQPQANAAAPAAA